MGWVVTAVDFTGVLAQRGTDCECGTVILSPGGTAYARNFAGPGVARFQDRWLSGQPIHGRGGITLPPPPEADGRSGDRRLFRDQDQDDYRWLEDANSPETKAFIDAENAYTARYMEQARIRPQISDDLDALEHVTAWTVPIQRGNDLFFEKLLAGEEQPSIYVRHGWTEKDKRLIDPAQFSRDPNTSVNLADVSRDGTLVAYLVRAGGADETTVRIFNVKTGKTLDDELPERHLPERGLHAGRERALLLAQDAQGIAGVRAPVGSKGLARTSWSSGASFAARRWARAT